MSVQISDHPIHSYNVCIGTCIQVKNKIKNKCIHRPSVGVFFAITLRRLEAH